MRWRLSRLLPSRPSLASPRYTLSCPVPLVGSFTSLLAPGALPSVSRAGGGGRGPSLALVFSGGVAAAPFRESCWTPLPRCGAASALQWHCSQRCSQGSRRLCPQGPWTSSAGEQGQQVIVFLLSSLGSLEHTEVPSLPWMRSLFKRLIFWGCLHILALGDAEVEGHLVPRQLLCQFHLPP